MSKELPPKDDINNGELFQTLILERHRLHDFDLREVQQDVNRCKTQWLSEEKNEGMTVSHYKNLTCREDQEHQKFRNNFSVKHSVSIKSSKSQYYKHDIQLSDPASAIKSFVTGELCPPPGFRFLIYELNAKCLLASSKGMMDR